MRIQVVLCLLACVIAVLAVAGRPPTDETLFQQFKLKYDKQYATPAEESIRFQIFTRNLKTIANLNAAYPKATFGATKFADLSHQEFKDTYLSTHTLERDPAWPTAPLYSSAEVEALPDSWDWRDHGAVTAVKDQGQCGSCWAFSTTGNMEGQWFLAGNTLPELSEQNLVDCDHECMQYQGQQVCDQGCDGGLMPNAFEYIIQNGIESENDYPYTGADGTCQFDSKKVVAHASNYTMISGDETQMAAWLVKNGPIAIAVDAEPWQFYIGGVYYLPCGTSLDHGVLLVGYGVETDIFDQTMPYWIIKNSWSSDWGESGYIRVERGVGLCGLNLFPCSAIIGK